MEITLAARPQPLKVETGRTALVVVDMQNAFCSRGGLFDVLGMLDEARLKPVIANLENVIPAARKAGLKIIFLRMGFRPDMADAGGPESPNYWKEKAMAASRENPDLKGNILVKGSHDWQVIDELKPREGDILVDKNRYSGFPNTDLDIVLKTYNLKFLLFSGVFTNICVESTLRDAYFHEYFPVLLSDCCSNMGPDYTQAATIYAVEHVFGWVTGATILVSALEKVGAASD
jgi:ureidoacrylate peracid hydrolase